MWPIVTIMVSVCLSVCWSVAEKVHTFGLRPESELLKFVHVVFEICDQTDMLVALAQIILSRN